MTTRTLATAAALAMAAAAQAQAPVDDLVTHRLRQLDLGFESPRLANPYSLVTRIGNNRASESRDKKRVKAKIAAKSKRINRKRK